MNNIITTNTKNISTDVPGKDTTAVPPLSSLYYDILRYALVTWLFLLLTGVNNKTSVKTSELPSQQEYSSSSFKNFQLSWRHGAKSVPQGGAIDLHCSPRNSEFANQ